MSRQFEPQRGGYHVSTTIAIVVAVIAIGMSGWSIYVSYHQPQMFAPVGQSVTRSSPNVWETLTQKEVDALTAELKKPELTKGPVSIFCSDSNCDDLALDFDNAFESAGWSSGIERPLSDTNVGINVARICGKDSCDPRGGILQAAIVRATDGKIVPGLVTMQGDPGRLAVILSRKFEHAQRERN